MNKVTCPYTKAFTIAKKRLASSRHRDEQARMHHHLFPIHLKKMSRVNEAMNILQKGQIFLEEV
jgi:hypothetical protein